MRLLRNALFTLTLFLLGCSDEPMRIYEVPREKLSPIEQERQAARQQQAPRTLQWDAPQGWTVLPSAQFRLGNYALGQGNEKIEMTVSRIAGTAGGPLANANRWRGQIGLAALSQDELNQALLPVDTQVGTPAMTMHFAGETLGVRAAILLVADESWFVKMMGPKQGVLEQEQAFLALTASLRPGQEQRSKPSAPAAAAAEPSEQAPRLHIQRPAQWTEGKPSQIRLVSWAVQAGEEQLDFAIIPLDGGGDEKLNVERWCREVGLPDSEAAPIMAAKRELQVAGEPAALYELLGESRGTLIAAFGKYGKQWFVKLHGSRQLLEKERETYLSVLQQLHFDTKPH